MTAWFQSLTARERFLIGGAMPLALIALVVNFVWLPLQAAQARHTADIAAYRLVVDTAALAALTPQEAVQRQDIPSEPLATRITRAAEDANISVRRIEPDGDGMRVTLAETPFAQIVVWLADLDRNAAVHVTAIEIDRRPEPGIVTARILLESL